MQRPDLGEKSRANVCVAAVVHEYDRDWVSARVRRLDDARRLLSRRLPTDPEVGTERPLQFGLDGVELYRVRVDRQ
jgi:hypothetical protein